MHQPAAARVQFSSLQHNNTSTERLQLTAATAGSIEDGLVTERLPGLDELEVHGRVGEEEVEHAVDRDGEDVVQRREAVVFVVLAVDRRICAGGRDRSLLKGGAS